MNMPLLLTITQFLYVGHAASAKKVIPLRVGEEFTTSLCQNIGKIGFPEDTCLRLQGLALLCTSRGEPRANRAKYVDRALDLIDELAD